MSNNHFLKNLELLNEFFIYILIIFLFMDKGETLRVIGIYIPFSLLIIRFLVLKENPIRLNNSILLFILFCLFCLSGIIASLFAPSFLYSLEWFKRTYLKLFLVGIVFLGFLNSQDKIIRLTYLFIIMALIFTIFTYYDFYKKILILNEDYGKSIRKYIVPLEIFLPFVFFLFIKESKLFKFLGLFLLILGSVAVILTGSRGGWISLFISFFICAYGYFYLNKVNFKWLISIIMIILLIFCFLINIISPNYINMKFKQLLKGDTSLRIEIVWPAAIEIYSNLSFINKIFGNGLGRMTYLEDFRKWYLDKFNHQPSETYSPHNFYLSILYKQGIVGLVIFIILVFVCMRYLIYYIRFSKQNIDIKIIGISILAALSGLLIHSLVEDMRFIQWIFILPVTIGYLNYIKPQKGYD